VVRLIERDSGEVCNGERPSIKVGKVQSIGLIERDGGEAGGEKCLTERDTDSEEK